MSTSCLAYCEEAALWEAPEVPSDSTFPRWTGSENCFRQCWPSHSRAPFLEPISSPTHRPLSCSSMPDFKAFFKLGGLDSVICWHMKHFHYFLLLTHALTLYLCVCVCSFSITPLRTNTHVVGCLTAPMSQETELLGWTLCLGSPWALVKGFGTGWEASASLMCVVAGSTVLAGRDGG